MKLTSFGPLRKYQLLYADNNDKQIYVQSAPKGYNMPVSQIINNWADCKRFD